MSKFEQSPEGEKVRGLGFDLNEVLGSGWEDEVDGVENEDFQGVLSEAGPDRHICKVVLKDGRKVEIMSASVKSGNPFENMSHLGGGDFRRAEAWLYLHNPKTNEVLVISPDGKRTEFEGSAEQFAEQMETFEAYYANVDVSIAAFGGGSKEEEK